MATRENVTGRHAEPLQLVERQVDAVLARVLADVADDVSELKRGAERLGVLERLRIGVAEDSRSQQPDGARDVVAVALERLEVRVARLLQVHLHAVENLVQAQLRDAIWNDQGQQGASDRMLRRAGVESCDLAPPPRELCRR